LGVKGKNGRGREEDRYTKFHRGGIKYFLSLRFPRHFFGRLCGKGMLKIHKWREREKKEMGK
jgi:hypothetical protein